MNHPRPVVLVTGSSGLIGTAVCERLRQTCEVIGFDRAGPPHPPEHVTAIDVDLASHTSVREAGEELRSRCGGRLAAVIHLAAYYDFSGEPSELYEQITVQGTARLLRTLDDIPVEQFIYSSSMLVHAPTSPGIPITEESPLRPAWDYPKSKVKTEELLRENCTGIPLVILRIAGTYDAHCHSIPLAHQIRRIHERSITSRVFPGDPDHGQSFVHLDDVIEAVWLTFQRRHQLPVQTTLLIGETAVVSYAELQRIIARILHGEDWETRQIPKVVAKVGAWMQDNLPLGDDPFIKPWMIDLADEHYELDTTRARTLLDWKPTYDLRRYLPTMLAIFLADPARWYRDNKLSVALDADVSI